MMNLTNEEIRAAIDDCLSGADALPSVRASVMNQTRGEQKMKKKLSVGMIFAMLLTLAMMGAAVAAGLGLFGQLYERQDADERLPILERVSMPLGLTFEAAEGVTVTINQAYYGGGRVFISYTVNGDFDRTELGEGKPEGVTVWDAEYPGEVYGESWYSEAANFNAVKNHLNGSAPRWAKWDYVNVHDGLQIGETYLDIIGGDAWLTEDGSLIGWKECVVPEELTADEVTFSIGTFVSSTLTYQDETGFYESYGPRAATTWHDFTLQKDRTGESQLTGTASGEGWTATATLTASAIDVKGQVVVQCPQSWVEIQRSWENPEGIDCIRDWVFYVGGAKVEGWNLDGGCDPRVDGQLTFGICYQLDGLVEDMMLVPCFADGERVEMGIRLEVGK